MDIIRSSRTSRTHWLVHVQSKSKKFQNLAVITSPTICVFSIFSLFSLERCKSLELAAQNLGYKNFAIRKIYIFGKIASAERGKLNLHKQLTMYWKYLIYAYCFLFICIKELTLYHSLVSPVGDQHWIYICLLTWFWHLNKEIINKKRWKPKRLRFILLFYINFTILLRALQQEYKKLGFIKNDIIFLRKYIKFGLVPKGFRLKSSKQSKKVIAILQTASWKIMRTVLNENFTTKMILETKIKAKEMNLSILCQNLFLTIKEFVKKVTESHFEEKKLVQIRKFETLLATKLHN